MYSLRLVKHFAKQTSLVVVSVLTYDTHMFCTPTTKLYYYYYYCYVLQLQSTSSNNTKKNQDVAYPNPTMTTFTYGKTTFVVETTRQEESLRCSFRDANNKCLLELVLCPPQSSAALCHLKKNQTCSGTFVFKMGLAFAKRYMLATTTPTDLHTKPTGKQPTEPTELATKPTGKKSRTGFVMHVWDSAQIEKVHIGVLNLVLGKPTYYERLGFVFQDQEAIGRAKAKARILASQDMNVVHKACLSAQAYVASLDGLDGLDSMQGLEKATLLVAIQNALEQSRCKTFGEFVRTSKLACLRNIFDVSDLLSRSTPFFGLLFDLKLSYPSQLYLQV